MTSKSDVLFVLQLRDAYRVEMPDLGDSLLSITPVIPILSSFVPEEVDVIVITRSIDLECL